jgi:hypothetical protein
MTRIAWGLLGCLLLGGLLCGSASGPAWAGGKKVDLKSNKVQLDSVEATAPADWKREKPANRLRSYQFRLPRAKDDPADAELAILPNVLGSAEDNIKRWKEMFEPPNGKKMEEASHVDKFKVGKSKVTALDIHGTYMEKDRPFAPKSSAKPRPGYRMLAVIFETDEGSHFIRVVGPARTVELHKKGFDEWLRAFK